MQKKDDEQIIRKFILIRSRQLFALLLTVSLFIILAVFFKRPDIFGAFSKETHLQVQILIILAFINFSAFNWRCPACNKYLGTNIGRSVCGKCGARLK